MITGTVLILGVMLLYLLLNGMYLLLFAGGTLGGLLMFLRGVKTLRHVRDVPTSRIRSAAQGYVALQGRCLPLKPTTVLKAPLSAKPCLWYQFIVSARSRVDTEAPWSIVRQGSSQIPFVLDDGTGQCVVLPQGAATSLPTTKIWYGNEERPASATSDKPIAPEHARYRYMETILEPDTNLHLHGEFTSRPPDVSNAATDLINAWKLKTESMLARFDTNDDGEIDAHEMRVAMQAARQQARQEMEQLIAGHSMHMFGRPTDAARPFIISTMPQRTQVLLTRVQIWGGAAAFLGCGIGLILLLRNGL